MIPGRINAAAMGWCAAIRATTLSCATLAPQSNVLVYTLQYHVQTHAFRRAGASCHLLRPFAIRHPYPHPSMSVSTRVCQQPMAGMAHGWDWDGRRDRCQAGRCRNAVQHMCVCVYLAGLHTVLPSTRSYRTTHAYLRK